MTRGRRWLVRALWAAVLVTLPITSFRYYPAVLGASTSKPLAFLPAAGLVLLVLSAERRRAWARVRHGLPAGLLVWLLAAALSTAWALRRPPPPLSGYSLAARALRAWFSWAVGLVFLLAAVLAHDEEDDLDFTLRALFAGFGLTALWATLQLTALTVGFPSREALARAQAVFSLRPWAQARVQGLAYEPSWFADQLVVLYGAWLAAALFTGYARPWKHRAVVWMLSLWALGLLVWTYSRSGVLVAAVAAGAVGLRFGLRLGRGSWRRWALAAGLAGVLAGLFAAAAQRSDYFRVLFDLKPGQTWVDYVVQARAGARLAYAGAAWQVFEEHPWLGVGLGGSGLYLYEHLPEWSRTELRDVAYALSPEHRPVLNPKSMYARLLAETGIVGMAAFAVFVLGVLARAEALARAPGSRARFAGLAGWWLVVAMAMRWFTQDALSLPTFWVVAGVVLAFEAASRAPAEPVPPHATDSGPDTAAHTGHRRNWG